VKVLDWLIGKMSLLPLLGTKDDDNVSSEHTPVKGVPRPQVSYIKFLRHGTQFATSCREKAEFSYKNKAKKFVIATWEQFRFCVCLLHELNTHCVCL
jgi:hypothetical protein